MLSKVANVSYNLASKYDVQMNKRRQLLGDHLPGLRPWTLYRHFGPRYSVFCGRLPYLPVYLRL